MRLAGEGGQGHVTGSDPAGPSQPWVWPQLRVLFQVAVSLQLTCLSLGMKEGTRSYFLEGAREIQSSKPTSVG